MRQNNSMVDFLVMFSLGFLCSMSCKVVSAPAPPPKVYNVEPGHYKIQSGGIWDFRLEPDGTLISTHAYTETFYTGFWKFDKKTQVLTLRLKGDTIHHHWTTARLHVGAQTYDIDAPELFNKRVFQRVGK